MLVTDSNKDGLLSVDEFAQLPPGVVEGDNTDSEYQAARRKEFNEAIDVDKDGFATQEELVAYMNPTSEGRIGDEVSEIFAVADADNDQHLTLNELLDNAESLAASSFIRPKLKLHEDL